MQLKLAAAAVLALGLVTAATGAAEARDGCGGGFHRGPYGGCRPNFGPRPFYGRPGFYGYGGWHRPGYYGWHRGWRRHW